MVIRARSEAFGRLDLWGIGTPGEAARTNLSDDLGS